MRLRLSVLSSLLIASISAQADPGRVQISAIQSNISIFGADGMLPLLGNQQHFVYGDIMGSYGTDDTYLASPGLGYRAVVNNQIWGGYVFSDYERTSLGENFWVMSPGVEWMNATWDTHVNGYFPVQSRQQNGNENSAEEGFGVYGYGKAHGYSYDDALLTPYAVIGNGVDTEVGYSFDQGDHLRSRVFLGGYYYHPQDAYDVDNINGVTAGYTKSFTKNFTVSLLNSYDNLNGYTFGINLTATLGGDSNTYSDDIQDRLLDPVARHIGIIDTGAGTNDQQSYQVTGQETTNGIVYTSADASPDGLGTAEDPAQFTQDTLDMASEMFPEGSKIYVEGGENADYTLTSTLSLYDYQGIFGRGPGYTTRASNDAQPQITAGSDYNDAFYINNTTNTISDVTIKGQSGSLSGITINGQSDVTLYNVNISGFTSGGCAGVYVYNTADLLKLTIENSAIDNNAEGIHAENVGSGELIVDISNSSASDNLSNDLTLWNNINTGGGTGTAFLTVNNSRFLNTGTTSGNTGIVIANGADGAITATIDNSTISGNRSSGMEVVNNTDGGNGQGDGTGVGEIHVTVHDSTFNHNGYYESGEGPGVYIANNGPGTTDVNIYDSTINDNKLYGVYVENLSADPDSIMQINLARTSFKDNQGGYDIYGFADAGSSTRIEFPDHASTNQSSGDNITWIPA